MPNWIGERYEATPCPEEGRGIERSDGERLMIDPAGSSGIRIEQDLKTTVKDETIVVTGRPNSAADIIRGFENVDGNTGFK